MFTHIPNPPITSDIKTVNRNGGRWYLTPDGDFPSVTTILGTEPKPALENWKNMLGPAKAKQETDRCAERGTAVHTMCELYINNVDMSVITKNQQREHLKLFNQIKLALNKRVDNVHIQEIALWSNTLKLAGRVDLIAEYDGVLSIVDFKTSSKHKQESNIQDYFIQCTAYAVMYNEMFNCDIEDIVVVITTESGLMPLVYKKKIYDYIDPLLDRLDSFYRTVK